MPKYNSDKVERVQRRSARFVKSRLTRHSSVSNMLDDWDGHPFLKGDRRLDYLCYTKLFTVWHKCPSKASLLRRIIIQIFIKSPISNVHRDTSSVDYIITTTYIYNN